MKVLVACEYSGTVRDAFLALGHEALSCDLLPTDSPGPHYQGDVRDVLYDGWDLMVAHPPCTYLSVSGMHWTARGLRDPQLTEDALDFVRLLMDAPIPRIAVENPVSVISSRIRKPDQVVQPWEYGHDASKKTCLWLKNLPKLQPTNIVQPKLFCCGIEVPESTAAPTAAERNAPRNAGETKHPAGRTSYRQQQTGGRFAAKLTQGLRRRWQRSGHPPTTTTECSSHSSSHKLYLSGEPTQ